SAGCSQLVAPGNDGSLELDMRRVTFIEGALQVEAIDPHSARVLWSAINRGTVRRSDARQNRLNAIATQTLAELPARSSPRTDAPSAQSARRLASSCARRRASRSSRSRCSCAGDQSRAPVTSSQALM